MIIIIIIGLNLVSVQLSLINSFIVDTEKHLSMSFCPASCSRFQRQYVKVPRGFSLC